VKVTILGCGGARGIPVLGRGWGHCDPENPKNRRMRSSALVEVDGRVILIDAGHDTRQQLLNAGVTSLDAILLSHSHSDHILGLDDLRSLSIGLGDRMFPVYGSAKTLAETKSCLPWLFVDGGDEYHPPCLEPRPVTPGLHDVVGVPVVFHAQPHGPNVTSYGFRIGNFAYTPDNSDIPPENRALLKGLDTWVVSAPVRRAHPLHSSLSSILGWEEELKPRQTYLTHMNRHMDYETLCRELPENVRPAYDGLVLEVKS